MGFAKRLRRDMTRRRCPSSRSLSAGLTALTLNFFIYFVFFLGLAFMACPIALKGLFFHGDFLACPFAVTWVPNQFLRGLFIWSYQLACSKIWNISEHETVLQLVHLQETHADREFQIHPCKVFEPRNEMSTLLQVLRNFQLRDVHVQMRAEAVLVSTFSISHASQSICCELAFAILPCRQFWFSVARTLPGPYHRHNLCCIRIAAAGWAGGGLIRMN